MNSSNEDKENRVNKLHKSLDIFIQNSLNKFKFVEVKRELYFNTGDDINSIISHRSTIPDLVIWNKPFNKNKCFYNMRESEEYNKYPRVPFYLRLNNKQDKYRNRKNIYQYKRVDNNSSYEKLVDFVDRLTLNQKEEINTKEVKNINGVDANESNEEIINKQKNEINEKYKNSLNNCDILNIDKKCGNELINKDIYINDKGSDNNNHPRYKIESNDYVTPVNKTKKTMNDYYQNQFKQNEILMNYVYSYLDKKGWIVFRKDGDYVSNFTSFELFSFLTNILNSKSDLKIFIIGMQTDSMMFNGEQIYIILSQTLPIILQKKQIEFEMRKKKMKENESKKLFKLRNDEKENISDNYMANDCGKNSGNVQNKNVINLPNEYNSQKYYH